jgi:energy-coupling factor transporter ATP-binding protein EcfA2
VPDLDDFTLTIKNYRCFADNEPASIRFGGGFLALVGANNSGKSTLLRLFYELRPIWQNLCEAPASSILWNKSAIHPIGTLDVSEIFFWGNERPLVLEFEFGSARADECAHLRIEGSRELVWSTTMRTSNGSLLAEGADAIHVYGKVKEKAVSVDVSRIRFLFSHLTRALYIGPFRNAINTGAAKYYDLHVGTGFVQLWDNWKTGSQKSQNRAIEEVTEDIRRIFDLRKLEIAANPDRQTLQVNIDGQPHKLHELGAGLAQFIVTFGSAATQRPSILLIDEPELNLNPRLQIDFIVSLSKYARYGTWFCSHSIGLARAVGEQILSIQRVNEYCRVRPLEATSNYAELLGELSFSAYRELGFNAVLMVEGPTDIPLVQQWLRLYGLDHRVVVLHLGGSSSINAFAEPHLSELKRFDCRVFVLIDSERNADDQPLPQERQDFMRICSNLGFTAHATGLKASDNYLTDSAIKRELGEKFSALEPFERHTAKRGWSKRSSWRIAAHMTREDIERSDLSHFFSQLAK